MLLAGAGRADFDALLEAGTAEALAAGLGEAGLAELRRQHSLALRVRDQMVHQASRESELSALNQTAIDLNEIRDLDRTFARYEKLVKLPKGPNALTVSPGRR